MNVYQHQPGTKETKEIGMEHTYKGYFIADSPTTYRLFVTSSTDKNINCEFTNISDDKDFMLTMLFVKLGTKIKNDNHLIEFDDAVMAGFKFNEDENLDMSYDSVLILRIGHNFGCSQPDSVDSFFDKSKLTIYHMLCTK
jgi:hypothetical protein